MDITSLIVQLVSGAVGGNAAGALFKNISLGTLGNSIAGIVGGGIGGQILQAVLGVGGGAGGLGSEYCDLGQLPRNHLLVRCGGDQALHN